MAEICKDIGCILRLMPLGENGLLISAACAQHGIVRCAARNARKAGGELAGQIDLFHDCELLYSPPSHGDLCSLKSAVLLNPRLPLRKDLHKLQSASYMARLLLATVEVGSMESVWHGLISKALDYLAESRARKAIILRFEQRLAELHGLYTPQISPYATLLRHYRSLPAGREELMQKLP